MWKPYIKTLWLAFIMPGGALQAAGEEKSSAVLPNCELCELQKSFHSKFCSLAQQRHGCDDCNKPLFKLDWSCSKEGNLYQVLNLTKCPWLRQSYLEYCGFHSKNTRGEPATILLNEHSIKLPYKHPSLYLQVVQFSTLITETSLCSRWQLIQRLRTELVRVQRISVCGALSPIVTSISYSFPLGDNVEKGTEGLLEPQLGEG